MVMANGKDKGQMNTAELIAEIDALYSAIKAGDTAKQFTFAEKVFANWPAIKQALSTARADALEEAAKVCDEAAKRIESHSTYIFEEIDAARGMAETLAESIRALAKERA